MRRLVVTLALAAAASAAGSATAFAEGQWVAGDLHVHTTYSHDSYGGPTDDNTGPQDANTFGFTVQEDFTLAATRGLDYLAITDHNDIRSQRDPGFGFGGVIPIPAYENSLKGHAQMLGATRPPCGANVPPPCYDNGDKSVAAITRLAEALRGAPDQGIFQANHPADPRWEYQYDVPLDTVEAWNLPWVYKPPFPAASDNDVALAYWHGWLDRGAKVGLTGGSDSHWVITSAAQGPGQPTTWVFAGERSARGVLEGLRAGHTFVSHQPPNYDGPKLFLEADGDRNGSYESIVGDTVPPGSPLRVRVTGAAGDFLRVVTDGGREAFEPVPITSADFEHRFTLPSTSTWTHAQVFGQDLRSGRQTGCTTLFGADVSQSIPYCYDQVLMLAMSSPIYLRSPQSNASPGPSAPAGGCLNSRSGAGGRRLGPARLGEARSTQRRRFAGLRLSSRRGVDRYCLTGGGSLRIGYPTARISRAIGRSLRRRVRGRALLVLTDSPLYSIAGVSPGSSIRLLGKRLGGGRRLRIGANLWYTVRGAQSRLVFKARRRRVLEVGLASSSLSRTRASESRLLRAWAAG